MSWDPLVMSITWELVIHKQCRLKHVKREDHLESTQQFLTKPLGLAVAGNRAFHGANPEDLFEGAGIEFSREDRLL